MEIYSRKFENVKIKHYTNKNTFSRNIRTVTSSDAALNLISLREGERERKE